MEIIVPGGTRRAAEGGGSIGYGLRLTQVRHSVGYLPPWRCDSFKKGRFYLCGRCFGTLGDGPATNAEEIWMVGTDRSGAPILERGQPLVPDKARCEKCLGPAWPAD